MAEYANSLKIVKENNLLYNNGSTDVILKINKLADLTEAEFFKQKVGFKAMNKKITPTASKSAKKQTKAKKASSLPASVDWRTKGAVTPIKDQKNCGSCWSFSATGALEGQMFTKYNKSVSLSEQQMVDCGNSLEPYLMGCQGGVLEEAFDYVKLNNGIDTETSYPYTALDNGSCHFNSSNIGATCKGYVSVKKDENSMMEAVANNGPISVSIGVNKKSSLYSSGLFPKNMCYFINNHGVLIVGYGADATGKKYWIVKNSWGTNWGMNGYFYLPRGKNACGVKRDPLYPLV